MPFQLSDGVRVAGAFPIDFDRYLAINISARDAIITQERAFVGLQVFVVEDSSLYILLGSTVNDWKKLGGGAEIEENFTVSIQTGGYSVGDPVVIGETFTEVMIKLLAPLVPPNVKTESSVSITGITPGTLEIGTTITATLDTVFDPGKIASTNIPQTSDVDLTGAKTTAVYSGDGVSGNNVNFVLTTGDHQWSVTQQFAIGTGVCYGSDGEPSTALDAERGPSPGTTPPETAISGVITGKYRSWWLSGSIPTTSGDVRNIPNTKFFGTGYFDISIPAGTLPIAFYIPDAGATVRVEHIESSYNNVTGYFTSVDMIVEDANGDDVDYKRYQYTLPGSGFQDNATFRVYIT